MKLLLNEIENDARDFHNYMVWIQHQVPDLAKYIETHHDQSIPQDIIQTHELEAITIHYRCECKYSDTIDSLATTELEVESVNPFQDESTISNLNLNSEGRHQFLHLLKFSGTDQEINRGRTIWRKIDKWYTNGQTLVVPL